MYMCMKRSYLLFCLCIQMQSSEVHGVAIFLSAMASIPWSLYIVIIWNDIICCYVCAYKCNILKCIECDIRKSHELNTLKSRAYTCNILKCIECDIRKSRELNTLKFLHSDHMERSYLLPCGCSYECNILKYIECNIPKSHEFNILKSLPSDRFLVETFPKNWQTPWPTPSLTNQFVCIGWSFIAVCKAPPQTPPHMQQICGFIDLH